VKNFKLLFASVFDAFDEVDLRWNFVAHIGFDSIELHDVCII